MPFSNDDITPIIRLAATVCKKSSAAIYFPDEQGRWHHPDGQPCNAMEQLLCHAVVQNRPFFEKEDILLEPTLRKSMSNPPGFRAFAGALLENEQDAPAAVLAVMDPLPAALNEEQRELFSAVADAAALLVRKAASERTLKVSEQKYRAFF